MSFTIQKATRTGVKPLVGWYGRSGSGKTMSALLFARGLVGDKGRIVLIDSEAGRGSIFADVIPGGYSVIEITPPFSPDRYAEAFATAEKDADVVVIDSLSHEHNGEGGLIDMQEAELNRMAGDDYRKREQCKLAAWIKPKLSHKSFIAKILRCKCALVCCLRAEEKTHITKGADGKSKVITDEFSSPLFDKRFVFELLLSFESIAINGVGGYVIPRKITHPAIAKLLPSANEQIGIKHGQALAEWCANVGGAAGGVPSNSKPVERTAGDGRAAASPSPETPRTRPLETEGRDVSKDTSASPVATLKTREWMIAGLADMQQDALGYFIDAGMIMPNETLLDVSLNKVPTTKPALETLRANIKKWSGK